VAKLTVAAPMVKVFAMRFRLAMRPRSLNAARLPLRSTRVAAWRLSVASKKAWISTS